MSFGAAPAQPARERANPLQPRRDRSVEAQRRPLPSVPRAPRPRQRSNSSAGALSRAVYLRGDSRPGSASSKGSNDGRLSRCGSGIVREESPQNFARVHALERHDSGQEQSLAVGPPPRPFSAHSSNGDFRRGRSLSVDASARPPVATGEHHGARRHVLAREAQGEDQGLEFFPRANDCSVGRPSSSGNHRRVDQLNREFTEKSDQKPKRTDSAGRRTSGGPEFPRKNVLVDEAKRAAPSCGAPKPPRWDADGPIYNRNRLLGRDEDIGFSAVQICSAGA